MSQLAMKETPGSLLDTEKYRSLFPVPPSTRRVWIEIRNTGRSARKSWPSPSTRRVWIEILPRWLPGLGSRVTLHTEGVDRNELLIPCGLRLAVSPSTRRVWIEIRRKNPPDQPIPVTLHTEGVDYKLGMKNPSPLKEWSIPR